jgi:hypothetical protein
VLLGWPISSDSVRLCGESSAQTIGHRPLTNSAQFGDIFRVLVVPSAAFVNLVSVAGKGGKTRNSDLPVDAERFSANESFLRAFIQNCIECAQMFTVQEIVV